MLQYDEALSRIDNLEVDIAKLQAQLDARDERIAQLEHDLQKSLQTPEDLSNYHANVISMISKQLKVAVEKILATIAFELKWEDIENDFTPTKWKKLMKKKRDTHV